MLTYKFTNLTWLTSNNNITHNYFKKEYYRRHRKHKFQGLFNIIKHSYNA